MQQGPRGAKGGAYRNIIKRRYNVSATNQGKPGGLDGRSRREAAGEGARRRQSREGDFRHRPSGRDADFDKFNLKVEQPRGAGGSPATPCGALQVQVSHGAAMQAEGLWWEYVTTVDHPGGVAKVLVTAQDLPGHAARRKTEKSVT